MNKGQATALSKSLKALYSKRCRNCRYVRAYRLINVQADGDSKWFVEVGCLCGTQRYSEFKDGR